MITTWSHLHNWACHPHKRTLLYRPMLQQTKHWGWIWCCVSDAHKICGCVPFVDLITKPAHNTDKNRWRAANKRENKWRKSGTYTEHNDWHGLIADDWNIRGKTNLVPFRTVDRLSKQLKLAQFPFHNRKHRPLMWSHMTETVTQHEYKKSHKALKAVLRCVGCCGATLGQSQAS